MRTLVLLVGALAALATAPAQAIDLGEAVGGEPRHSIGPAATATCSGGGSCTTGMHSHYAISAYFGTPLSHGFRASDNPRFTGNVESKIRSTLTNQVQTVTCSIAGGNPSCNTQGSAPYGNVEHTCRLINGFGTWTCFITHSTFHFSICPGPPPFCIGFL